MFQTEIHIFIQSLASDFLTAFFKFFTVIGKGGFTIPIVIAIIFGIHFRGGTIILHLVLWNGLITDFFKETFALPRPANVDSRVQLLGKSYPNPTPYTAMGAKSFFGLLPGEVVEAFRSQPFDSWGLPSGHTSNAAALWGSLALFAKKTWLTVICILCIICIPLSRIYLGRHFLADVLAGFLIGFSLLALFYKPVLENESLKERLFNRAISWPATLKPLLFSSYMLALPLLLLLIPRVDPRMPPLLLGLNCGFLLLRKRGLPEEGGTWKQRVARVLLAFALYVSSYIGLEKLFGLLYAEVPGWGQFIQVFLVAFLLLWGSAELCIKLRLYRR